jgi:DNA/RNA-binding domain of Phe-tRNA-synthetase-like protein
VTFSLAGHEVLVSSEIGQAHPGYRAGFVVAEGVTNGPSDDLGGRELAAAERRWSSELTRAADHPHIAAWRRAFSGFGAKPSRFPSSAEALMSRAIRGAGLPRVNRLVDLYNAVSVKHAIPVGGEDLDALAGPVRLFRAAGDEPFDAAPGAVEHPRPGEVVWADAAGVTCRRWNWRQGHRTRLTGSNTRAYFLFDALPPLGDDELRAAMDELAALLASACPDARLSTAIVRADRTRSTEETDDAGR